MTIVSHSTTTGGGH